MLVEAAKLDPEKVGHSKRVPLFLFLVWKLSAVPSSLFPLSSLSVFDRSPFSISFTSRIVPFNSIFVCFSETSLKNKLLSFYKIFLFCYGYVVSGSCTLLSKTSLFGFWSNLLSSWNCKFGPEPNQAKKLTSPHKTLNIWELQDISPEPNCWNVKSWSITPTSQLFLCQCVCVFWMHLNHPTPPQEQPM